jgi:sirohydrochlorin cobaltochelatase
MKRLLIEMAEVLALAFIAPVNGAMDRPAKDSPAVLLVMFGTSYPKAQVAYGSIERIYKDEFPEAKIQIAFTSDYIRRKIQERDNISINNPLTALARLNDEGYVNVVVQSLHVIPGEEFHDMANIVESIRGIDGKFGFKNLTIGAPLLMSGKDYRNVSTALEKQFDEFTTGTERTRHKDPRNVDETAIVFMGYGTEHPANNAYSQMANILAADHKNVFMGTVEGYPTYDEVVAGLKEAKVENVMLMPFMVVAGDPCPE